jgi:hypothetical protein
VVNFPPKPLYPKEDHWYPVSRLTSHLSHFTQRRTSGTQWVGGWVGPQSWPGCFGEENRCLAPAENGTTVPWLCSLYNKLTAEFPISPPRLKMGTEFWQEQAIFLSCKMPSLALGPSQSPIQQITGARPPEVENLGLEAAHSYLVPTLLPTAEEYVTTRFSPTDHDEVKATLDAVVKHKIGRPIALPSGFETQSVKYVSRIQETGFGLSVSSICHVAFRLVRSPDADVLQHISNRGSVRINIISRPLRVTIFPCTARIVTYSAGCL